MGKRGRKPRIILSPEQASNRAKQEAVYKEFMIEWRKGGSKQAIYRYLADKYGNASITSITYAIRKYVKTHPDAVDPFIKYAKRTAEQ